MPLGSPRRADAWAAACFSFAIAAAGCSRPAPDERAASALDLVPGDAAVVVSITSLTELHRKLDVASMRLSNRALIDRIGTALRSEIGFDLTDLDTLRAQGVDPDRPAAVALFEEPNGATIVVLPGDGPRLVERLAALSRSRGAPMEVTGTHAGVPMYDAPRAGSSLLPLAHHAVLLSGVPRADERRALAERVLDDAGRRDVASTAAFLAVRARLPEATDILVYEPPWTEERGRGPRLAEMAGAPLKLALSFLQGDAPHRGSGFATSVEGDGLSVDAFTRSDDPTRAFWPPAPSRGERVPFIEKIDAEPLALFQAHVDPEEAWARIEARRDAARAPAASDSAVPPPDTEPGWFDVHDDLVAHLEGRIGVLASRIGIVGADVVFYATARDGKALGATLARVVERLRTEPADLPMLGSTAGIVDDEESGVSFYRLPLLPFAEICCGIVEDHLVLTTTRERMVAIARGRKGFVLSLPGPELRTAIREGHLFALYLDVDAIGAAIGALPLPQAGQYRGLLDGMRAFQHVTAITDVVEGGYAGTVRVRAKGPGVWPRLLESMLRVKQRSS